ncbi:gluconokinase [Candidatus Vecturithrix granuli]|uniref:Gluconokinase n=1 Tax=Vecturithrix granuli TaxID=1499967 RepID=A0A0S6WA75_VECG1|nr:gluconokinase [Candidatus Vecturithrix granuli]
MKTQQWILAIDMGTSATKGVLFDLQGKVKSVARKSYPMLSPQIGWSEQEPELVFEAVLEVLRETYASKPAEVEIPGIAFSSQMYSILAIDREGKPLSNSLTWADRRSAEIASAFRQHPDARELYQRTGCPLDAIYPFSKIKWLQAQANNDQIARFISIKEYVLHNLLGEYVVDWSTASATGMFDIRQHIWNPLALELLDISEQQLSAVVPPGQILSDWKPDILTYTQIPAGTPCIIGGGDGPMASLGVGAVQSDILAVNVGTSAAARSILPAPVIDSHGNLWTYALDGDSWVIGGITSSGGILYDWFTTTFATGVSHVDINNQVATIAPGAEGLTFIPYLGGEQCPVWNPNTRGSFLGMTFTHTYAHFIRAVLEGITRSIYRMTKSIELTIQQPFQEIRVTGGLTSSSTWLQIAADMFGCRVVIPDTPEGSARGAAFMALKVLGMTTAKTLISENQAAQTRIEPNVQVHQFYMEQDEQFDQSLAATKSLDYTECKVKFP